MSCYEIDLPEVSTEAMGRELKRRGLRVVSGEALVITKENGEWPLWARWARWPRPIPNVVFDALAEAQTAESALADTEAGV